MIKTKSVKAVIMAVTILSLVTSIYGETILALRGKEKQYVSENMAFLTDSLQNKIVIPNYEGKVNLPKEEEIKVEKEPEVAEALSEEELQREALEAKKQEVVYDGMTLQELSDKLNRTLNSTLSGQGMTFATKAIDLGIDPYLAVAIVMHETGCKWNCSSLLKRCNNVGGMKGSGCSGSSYAGFATLEEGINAYMNNLYKNYISKGLTTAEAIGPKYAASNTWTNQVNTYINEIKAA